MTLYMVHDYSDAGNAFLEPLPLSVFSRATLLKEIESDSQCESRFLSISIGLPGEIRTPDLMVRSHALYPAGLRADRSFEDSS